MDTQTYCPVVSIIIPAYNAQGTIGRCLEAIHKLEYPAQKLEVIVIDNGSEDETAAIARGLGAKVIARPGIFVSEMRNQGAEMAAGEALGFVDSDCIVSPQWLLSALRHLGHSSVAIAGCGYAPDLSPSWIERHWHYQHLSPAMEVNFVPAGNMLIRKSVFQRIEGFDPLLETGEDSDLCLRLRKAGYRIISDGGIRSVHLGNPKSLSVFLRKEIWYGKGLAACMNWRDWRDRTFLMANLFLAAQIVLVAGILLFFIFGARLPLVAGAAGVGLVVLVSTIYRTAQRRALRSFFHLALLNAVYYFGRSISLLHIYFHFFRRPHRPAK